MDLKTVLFSLGTSLSMVVAIMILAPIALGSTIWIHEQFAMEFYKEYCITVLTFFRGG